uniref:RNA polymerase II subunit A C-terminal domain phosphatase SSU72 n=1 Tax=Anthurium amnicola TaxID=1678845 RepID=A0A1D1Y7L1_9ARAE
MKLRYAMVCSSNQNRSMEAHSLMKRQGFDVSSYGTGAHVKLPGPSLREPNIYDFGTPYKHMYDELRRKDPDLYKRNGILPMLKRNSTIKLAPQRWQDNVSDGSFDVVLSFEEKVFDMVLDGQTLARLLNYPLMVALLFSINVWSALQKDLPVHITYQLWLMIKTQIIL